MFAIASGDPFARLSEWAAGVVDALGYGGVIALIALETVFPPIPSELILPLAGFLAGQGRMWLPAVIVAATIGSVAGALVLYGLGAWLGEARLRRIVRRYGVWLAIGEPELERAGRWFDRHGAGVVLIGRVVPLARSLVSLPAGIRRMPLGRFVLYTSIGSAAWNSLLIGLGWFAGQHWEAVRRYAQVLELAVLAAFVAALVWLVARRIRTIRGARAGDRHGRATDSPIPSR